MWSLGVSKWTRKFRCGSAGSSSGGEQHFLASKQATLLHWETEYLFLPSLNNIDVLYVLSVSISSMYASFMVLLESFSHDYMAILSNHSSNKYISICP